MDNINKQFEEKWNSSDVINIMNKVGNRYSKNIDADELDSIKMDTLWRCVKKYDESRGSKFTSYLYQQLSYALKNKTKKKRNEFNVENNLEKPDTKAMSREYVFDIVTGMEEEETHILHQRFFKNMTMKEIGHENGYSRETARRKLKNAVETCKSVCLD